MPSRPYAFGCVLGLRTSSEFKTGHSYGHFFPDPQYENVQHIICCDSYATPHMLMTLSLKLPRNFQNMDQNLLLYGLRFNTQSFCLLRSSRIQDWFPQLASDLKNCSEVAFCQLSTFPSHRGHQIQEFECLELCF
ncbi:hypothetical protein RchiOBHm_Chr5g0040971 [Rosa chinensis]|uniref:Uncharacterized protein n=1 Tax=Rosa chinensis TaxID=74649 RepID=A0A2P6QCQ9_ROSCH|nr:hypothetical protein RchiOBHm_Chr5g0040971 [Rosa chinensis]